MDHTSVGKSLSVAVLLPGKADDGGWSESGARAAADLSLNANWQVTTISELGPEARASTLVDLVHHGVNLIIGHGCEFIDDFLKRCRELPTTYFFAMDTLEEREDWPGNYASLRQRQDEAVFLCGRLAAHMTSSGQVGFVGGMEVPTQVANARAFEHGAKSVDPSIGVNTQYAGTFQDPEKGRRMALELIERGTDFLMQTASETGNGVFEACIDNHVFTVGFILDKHSLAPDLVVTSLLVDVARVYRRKAQEVLDGAFRPGVWTVGLSDGVVRLAPFSSAVPAAAQADLEEKRLGIVGGRISL